MTINTLKEEDTLASPEPPFGHHHSHRIPNQQRPRTHEQQSPPSYPQPGVLLPNSGQEDSFSSVNHFSWSIDRGGFGKMRKV